MNTITHLFLDIGGVLLTNGWDRHSRQLAAEEFGLNLKEFEDLHQINLSVFEEGKLTLDEYLNRVVFYKKRSFTPQDFQRFIFSQSKPYRELIELLLILKKKYGLKIAALSNESREINAYRIETFKLDSLIDFFISSCYVKLRKPDTEIYHLALDVSQAKTNQVLYIENTAPLVAIAKSLGIASILHETYESTRSELADFGLVI